MSSVSGLNYMELSDHDRRHHMHPMTNPVALSKTGPDMFVRGEGIYLYTSDGRRFMDVSSGLCNVILGYGNQQLCEVAFATMQQLSYSSSFEGRTTPWAAALSAKLAEITPDSFQFFLFGSTGSEANESAVKLALRYWRLLGQPRKRAIISRRGSYHGNTLFAGSLTGIDAYHAQFGLPLPGAGIHHADTPYWYRDGNGRPKEQFGLDVARALEKQILEIGPGNIAAFIGDPIPGSSIVPPPDSYWPEVRRICDRHGILLISDEVITGFGKTGRLFGFERFDFEPDLFTMGKGISSGYFPLSAVAIGKKVADVLQNSDEVVCHGFTNNGHPVGAAVALATIAFIEENGLVDRVRNEIGPHFARRLNELMEIPGVGEVRTSGVLGAVDYDLPTEKKDAFYNDLQRIVRKNGVLTRGGLFSLPMIITKEQIDEAVSILKQAVIEAMSAIRS